MRVAGCGNFFRQPARTRRPAFVLAIFFLIFAAGVGRAADPQTDPSAALQKLAEQKFGQLSRAELLLVRGAAQRNLVWLGPSNDPASPDNDLARADNWGPERTVRAQLIRWIASDAEAARFVDPSGPGFAGAKVKGQIDFSYLVLGKPITILHSYVPDGVDFSNARTQGIDLRHSRTGPIDGDSATIDGDLSMLLGRYGAVSLFRTRVTGNLDFVGAHVSNPGGMRSRLPKPRSAVMPIFTRASPPTVSSISGSPRSAIH